MMKTLLSILCVLLLPVASWAGPISWVSTTDSLNTTGASTITMALTVPAGTDRLCVASVQARRSGGFNPTNVTGITFGGTQPFTFIRSDIRNNAVAIQTELWYLVAPAVATANVVATFANASNDRVQAISVTCLAGAGQSNQPDSHAGSAGIGATLSAGITTIADGAWIVDSAIGASSGGLTVGAGQTMRTDRVIGTSGSHGVGVSTVDGKATAGLETMDWTQSSSDWVYSVASFSPSGGAAPEPSIPGQVTLRWTNGTDPGTPSSGILNTIASRCTGTGCDARTAPSIGTIAYPGTQFIDNTVQTGVTYGYSVKHTDVVGLVSTPGHATVYKTTSGTPPPEPPKVAGMTLDTTGVTLAFGATQPTKVKIWTYANIGGVVSSVEYAFASLTGGTRHDEVWRAGINGVCVSTIDANGAENTVGTDYQCRDAQAAGVPLLDTTPPTVNCPSPINLEAGITAWTFTCVVDKPYTTARYDTTDVAYDLMTNNMALNALTFSADITGLTDGSTTTLYVRPSLLGLYQAFDTDEGVSYPALTSTVVVINVAATAGDPTLPNDVTNLSGDLLGTSVAFTWDHPTTGAASYQLYQSSGACSTYQPAGTIAAPPITITSLAFGAVYCWKMKAVNSLNLLSASFSNVVTKTTPPAIDNERPSNMGTITADPFTATMVLSWQLGTDNSNVVFSTIEYCAVQSGQTDCSNFISLFSQLPITTVTPSILTAGTRYCFRGKFSDPTGNVSLNYSPTTCATTPTIGLDRPRTPLQFGVTRTPTTRSSATGRTPRP